MPDSESEPSPPWLVPAGFRRPLAARTLSNGEPKIIPESAEFTLSLDLNRLAEAPR